MSLGPENVSQDAINLIVTEEDSSKEYYERHYTHFEWPQGASGPTIGIGYDCGYVAKMEAQLDWQNIVDDATLDHILRACGLRGEVAHQFVRTYGRSVTIHWDAAMKQFREREVPKWLRRMEQSLKNLDRLHPDSLGALLSLSYNRGCSYNLPGARYAEMRIIRGAMATGEFSKIPSALRSMKRLWPNVIGLRNRREHEAVLFEKGLRSV